MKGDSLVNGKLLNLSQLILAILSVTLATSAHSARAEGPASGEFPSFVKHTVDADFKNGYQVSVADIDRDGRLDIIALSTQPTQLFWYKNPDWEKHAITSATKRNIDAAPYDIDGDGDQDLALASDFSLRDSTRGGTVQWLECPADPVRDQEWAVHRIDAVPTSHRLRWADINGDGRKELLNLPIIGIGSRAPEYSVGVQFKAYRIPADPRNATWKSEVLDRTLSMAHGLSVVLWDDQEVVLTASFEGVHLFRTSEDSAIRKKVKLGVGHQAARPKQGSSEVGLGRLSSVGHRFVATIEPWHGHEVVVYTPERGEEFPWQRTVVDTTFNDGHALACVDLDRDGDDEIVAGHRGPGFNLFIYRYHAEKKSWLRIDLDIGGISAAGLAVADINQNGRPDIVATGTATNNVVWYENQGVSRDQAG
jgi:hypothetical protein